MAKFDTIKTAIDANINTNGTQAITGAVMNSVLKQMVDSTDTELTELESEIIYNLNKNNSTITYTLQEAIAAVPNEYRSIARGIVFKQTGLGVALAFFISDAYEAAWEKEYNWFVINNSRFTELDDKIQKEKQSTIYNLNANNSTTTYTLAEAISAIPTEYRSIARGIVFKQTGLGVALAFFTSDAYNAGWENEKNWFIVNNSRFTDLEKTISTLEKKTDSSIENLSSRIVDNDKDINNIINNISIDLDAITFDNLVLEKAYVDVSGDIKSWSSDSLKIMSYQASYDQYVRIEKTGSIYVTNEIICKCSNLDGISIGGHINGEIICIGTDYPFKAIIHLAEGEYLVRSGASKVYSTINLCEIPKRKLNGVRVDFEGDSVMEAKSSDGGWATLIQQMEGIVATNNGVSGLRIANNTSSTSILQKILSRNVDDFDMIVIQGGFNDGSTPLGTFSRNDYRDEGDDDYDASTFYGALEIICRYCLASFPKAMMIVGYNWGDNHWNATRAKAMVDVCEKWGMPYVDLRTKAGFNLHTESLRIKYGVYNGNVPIYDETKGYALDEKTKYAGKVYKAKQVISAPSGVFDASLWTYIGLEYDQCHCNLEGYKKSVGAIIQLMESL